MNLGATVFLRALVVLLGAGALTFLLVEPRFEGVNAHRTLFQIYFNDPFLAYVYVSSIPFFIALYHAFKVLTYAGRGQEFSPPALRSVRTIKYCAIALVGFVAGAEIFILAQESDDRAGGVMMGAFVGFSAIVVASAMTVLERALRNALAMKSEHDLTV